MKLNAKKTISLVLVIFLLFQGLVIPPSNSEKITKVFSAKTSFALGETTSVPEPSSTQ